MEELYKSLLSDHDVFAEQFMREIFELVVPDGPVMIYVNPKRDYEITDSGRMGFLQEEPQQLAAVCDRIDDGDDPCLCVVKGGCVVGTQLLTEKSHGGYFMLFLPGYTAQTVQSNMSVFELVLAQAQLISQLIEKNNQLHHLQLTHLSKTSKVLS